MSNPETYDVEFAAFVKVEGPRLLRFAQVLHGPSGAEDLLQDALTRTYVKWSYVRKGNPPAYVRRAIVNGRVSAWRRTRREQPLPESFDAPTMGDRYAQLDEHRHLVEALRQLPPQRRSVLVLRYLEDWDDAAIADALGMRRVSVRSAASRGLEQLRHHIALDSPSTTTVRTTS